MRKWIILAASALVVFLAFSVYAANKKDATTVSLTGGGYIFEGNQDYKNSYTIGARVGYNFTENFGTEVFFNYVPSEFEPGGSKNKFYAAGLEGIYHFMPRGAFVPYVAAGVGAVHYTSDDSAFLPSKVAVDYGAGFKFFITDYIAFRADARHVLPLGERGKYGDNPHKVHNDLLATVGLMFSFGGDDRYAEQMLEKLEQEKAAKASLKEQTPIQESAAEPVAVAQTQQQAEPVAAVGDADRDGVADNMDECPNTPASVVVDKKGCPPDSDKDGIVDYLDSCPDTPAGLPVDKRGCSPDTDRDGVADYLDKCPRTPWGVKVAADGCVYSKESVLLKIYFDSGKALVKKAYHAELQKAADFMKQYPEATATIVGHTDSKELPKRSMKLSEQRAESVRHYLIKKFGIDGSRIRALGYGAEKPIANNAKKEGRQQNRRAVALFEAAVKK